MLGAAFAAELTSRFVMRGAASSVLTSKTTE
jgi:hypothetical protein